jgi:hypothetical protein
MSYAKLFVLTAVAVLLAVRGASGQSTATIAIPLPVQIQDMMIMKRVKVRIATQGNVLFNMVWAKAHDGSVPAEPWEFLTAKGGGVFEAYVTMPMSGPFFVIGKVEWENPNNPGFPSNPRDIDYPTGGAFQAGFLKTLTLAQQKAYTNKLLLDASSAKLEVEVKGKKYVDIKFHEGFEKELQVRVGFLKDNEEIEIDKDELKLLDEKTDDSPHAHFQEVKESGQYWAHGYVKFGDKPEEQFLISKGPFNIKLE